MNEQHDDQQEEQVRRLLAASSRAGDDRMPDDVADRLDSALADLVAARSGAGADRPREEEAGPVPADEVTGAAELRPLHRRRWPQLLAAAAAVSVLGVGIGNLVGGPSPNAESVSAGSATSAGAPPHAAPASPHRSTVSAREPRQSGYTAHKNARELDSTAALRGTTPSPRLRSTALRTQVQRIEDFALAAPVADTPGRWAHACVHPGTGPRDEWLAVRLDGRPAVLVLRAPADGRRTAEVFTCGAPGSPAAGTTVRARR